MGFLKKILGGKGDDEKPPPPVRRSSAASSAPPKAPDAPPADSGVSPAGGGSKQWIRALGMSEAAKRVEAAENLAGSGDRAAIRPLLNAYLNYGDREVLEAIRTYGPLVTSAASHEAHDLSNVGVRRARLMDILGATGDESLASIVRENVNDSDPLIHVRAAVALARLGDLAGVDQLAADLQQATKDALRTEALRGLAEVRDIPAAQTAIDAHVARYLGQGGAIPAEIAVSAPRLIDPDTGMTAYLIDEIIKTPHHLVVVIGSGAADIVRSRQSDLRRGLPEHTMYFLTAQMAPDEQMLALEEARDFASDNPEHTLLVMGTLPAPSDSPPLRHFLTPGRGQPYTCKLITVDPHEYGLLMDWWRYVDDKAEIPTKFEVILSASSPERSAISEEEYLIYQLTPESRIGDFSRALLAHF
jgi:hypothetical protein